MSFTNGYTHFVAQSAMAYYNNEVERLLSNGVHGRPLFDIKENGDLEINVIVKVEGTTSCAICPVVIRGGDLKPVARFYGKYWEETTVYSDGESIFVDRASTISSNDGFHLFGSVDPKDRVAMLATMIHSVRNRDVSVFYNSHPATDFSNWYKFDSLGIVDPELAYEPYDGPMTSGVWRYFDEKVLRMDSEPYISVIVDPDRRQAVTITFNCSDQAHPAPFGVFRLDKLADARLFARRMVDAGYGSHVEDGCKVELYYPEMLRGVHPGATVSGAKERLTRSIWPLKRTEAEKEINDRFWDLVKEIDTEIRWGPGVYDYTPEQLSIITEGWAALSLSIEALQKAGHTSEWFSECLSYKLALDMLIVGVGDPAKVFTTPPRIIDLLS